MSDSDPDIDDIVMRLEAERPTPRPIFRGELERRLLADVDPSTHRVNLLIRAYASCGLFLLAVAGASLVDVGPLA